MTITDRIKELCDHKGITIAALERALDFGNGTIRRWSTTSPSVDKLKMVADYLGVNIDYLIGDGLNKKDHKDIAKDLENIMFDLETNEDSPLFYGDSIDETDKALLKNALQNALEVVKIRNKEKYTPTKYKQ
ncbi:MAG: helix-turn-helix transcriptional regulator [Cellulosilyticaceae bacterium]|uniref:helix-turn-helix domain-containing protein n=1 Tax=Niameybacter sp. TaxID=2033640 RepID=UPI002FCB1B61